MLTRPIIVVAVALGALACGEPPPPPRSPEPAPLAVEDARRTCPLGMTNAHVAWGETATGATLTFTTDPDHVRELQNRVHLAAEMRGAGNHGGPGHAGKHGAGGGRHGIQPKHLPPVKTAVEDVADGARITFTPDDPDAIELVRAKLKARAEKMMSRCDD